MKKLYLFLIAIVLFCYSPLRAQTPAAFTYQAVATDAAGAELAEQSIRVRASIVSSSPSGTVEWIETHLITTDPFGLFTLEIGRGAPEGGAQYSFNEISWGDDIHFLRIELDATGGTNYSLMGTSQLLSVPYALQAERANSAFRADVAEEAALAESAESALFAEFADSTAIAFTAVNTTFADSAAVAGVAATATFADTAIAASTAENANFALNAVSASISEVALTASDDNDRSPTNEIQSLEIDGDSLRISNGNAVFLNSTSENSLSRASLSFPQGFEEALYYFHPGSYTVPPGKNFYIVAAEGQVTLPNFGQGTAFTSPSMPILPPNTQIQNCRCLGFLMDESPDLTPVIAILQPNGANFFQVPFGKHFILKSGISEATPISLNNSLFNFFQVPIQGFPIPSNVVIRNIGNQELIITGYLKDNDL